MMELSRRKLFAGAAAAGAATALTPVAAAPAFAAAPAAGKQNAGWYRYKVGDFEVTVVTDGATVSALTGQVQNAPKPDVNAALEAMHLAPDKFTAWYNPIVVNTGSKLVAIDTGAGPGAYQQTKGALGQYHTNLAAAGIDKDAIDVVICSHLHGDHINGLLDAENKLVFPKAEVLMPAADIKFWTDDANAGRFPDPIKPQFANVKRVLGALGSKVTQYEGSKELVSGITSMPTPGHTPGHMSFMISSGTKLTGVAPSVSDSVLHQVDVTAGMGTLFARNPNWYFWFDVDGPLAEQTRRKFYDMVIADKQRIQGFHFPFPATGYIEKDGAGYRWAPATWNPTI
jgi:glyoxylase-like metal-dependent hydrolase (beta-lactamase superfamily II)